MRTLKKIVCFISIFSVGFATAFGSNGNGSINTTQETPEINGKLYTLGAALVKTPHKSNFEVIKRQMYPRRKNTPKGLEKIRVQYYAPTQASSKLALVMTGLGGDGKGNIGNFLAKNLSDKGFHAYVIPSLFFKRFAYAVSSTGHTGNIPEDAKDYYRTMQKLIKYCENKAGVAFSERHLLGYSLGAITALHIAHEDSKQQKINFKSTLALNPPVDLLHGIQVLDGYYERTRFINPIRKAKKYLDVGIKVLRNRFVKPSPSLVQPFFNSLVYNNDIDFELLISDSMRLSLAEIVVASQHAKDIGVLPKHRCRKRVRTSSRVQTRPLEQCRLDAAKKFKFIDYISKILVPFYREEYQNPNLTVEDIAYASSIPVLGDFISQSNNIFLLHNEDDILLRSSDPEYLKSVFKERAKIYKTGGHLGNVWTDKFLKQMDTFMATPQ